MINLSGAGVGDHRWTESYRAKLRSSRIVPTKTLAKAVADQGVPLLVNGSAIGGYGERGDEVLTESSTLDGSTFLGQLSIDWEAAALAAKPARVILLRSGLPLDRRGGLLQPMVLPFSLGLGGKLGDGKQWMPWISLEDWLRSVLFLLRTDTVDGPVNSVGPTPATNADFTNAFGGLLHRPTIMPLPRAALKVVIGQFAEEAYRSFRVVPEVLNQAGFTFEQPTIRAALEVALKR